MTKTTKRSGRKGMRKQRKSRVGGDVPAPAVRTYHTASCSLPPVTETCMVRAVASNTQTAQATAGTPASYAFNLSSAGVGSGFWDQYKIEAIRFTIAPQNNAIGLVTNSTTTLVPLYCVIDYDDSANLASAAAAQSYSNCVVLNPGESVERTFKPRMAIGAYSGSVFTGFANAADMWIDASSNTVLHYGVKLYIPGAAAAQTLLQSWDITIEYFIHFRKSI